MPLTAATPAHPVVARKKIGPWILRAVGVLAVVLIAAGLWLHHLLTAPLPQIDGSIRVAGLRAPVTVLRDSHGFPTIRAASMEDLLFAQGYVTAQDRLWQLDITRRYAAGETAEVLGPGLVEHDREQRILSIRQAVDHSLAQLNSHDRTMFEAYASGVNSFMEDHRRSLPIEFKILGYQPRPWTIQDSFLVGVSIVQYLNGYSLAHKLSREAINNKLGAEMAADLYPNKSWRDIPPGSKHETLLQQVKPAQDGSDDDDDSDSDVGIAALLHAPDAFASHIERGARPGSNNWVVSGAHTVSGKPLLSNDMHLRHQIPNVWYAAHLTAGDFDVAGMTLPGFPFVLAGHNQRIAWGFTNLGPDVQDVFIETTNSNGEYQTPEGWNKPETREEVIHVKGAPDVRFKVLTTRHGPVVSALSPGETRMLALKWALFDVGLQPPFELMDAARNWGGFRAALKRFVAPGQNVVYADVDGHIGYQATGAIPVRAAGDGALPVVGKDDAHEWKSYIPFEELPSVFDPPSGILATANGRIAADDYPHMLSTEWGSPYRTERIYRVLESGKKFSASDMLALQTDIYSAFDQFCAEKLVHALEIAPHPSSRARQAADIMRSWDGRMTKDSSAAAIEVASREELLRMMLAPRLGVLLRDYDWSDSTGALEGLLTRQPKSWLPRGFNSYDDLLAAAVERAVNDKVRPEKLTSWKWGSQYPIELRHPVLGEVPLLRRWAGPGHVQQSGDGETVKQIAGLLGPSERMTTDLYDLDRSTLNIVNGESGQILSPYFNDQWKSWYEGTTFAWPFSAAAVEKAAAHRLQLLPAN